MCIPGYWLAGFYPVAAPGRLLYPMGWGTLGFAFPAALGAALGAGSPVVCVCGDGGFLYACGELATISQEGLSVVCVIVDDSGYGMLRFDQEKAGRTSYGVDLKSPDFVGLAEAFDIEAEAVAGLGENFGQALERAISAAKPRVVVASCALEPPPTTSPRWYRSRT
jgi:acetolactate synthase-1/2/3 large subunit